ncbi:Dehydroquinate synthase-like protein [Aulographum hederae CBS 113979]|uniref:Dehydroquinate synthase-like protein n=1 Tax=Aulographum hederae CBS 113979 TaxID=1176131 RepID=A0A6G1HDG2_9PEZI|nr:Dehydroquinate synthase-like protein [Aulographum hederae CBS 113979]
MPSERIQQLPMPSRVGYDAVFEGSYLEDIPSQISAWKCQRILLVASKSLATTTDKICQLAATLSPLVVNTKHGVGSHSPYADVIDIGHRIFENDIDCIVCIGSSSYSDACKIARFMHSTLPPRFTAEDMENLIDQTRGAALGNLNPPKLKLIVVPTSLSASEWNAVSSCTNSQGKKQHYGDWNIDLWLSSGVRAVDHCVEIMCHAQAWEKGYEEVPVFAERGLRAMLKGLKEYKEGKGNGDEKELLKGISDCQKGARWAMSGLIIYRIPLGPSHAIGHQLGSVAGVMHGVTSCICLAPVLRYTKPKSENAQAKVLEIANDVLGWNETEAADAIARFVLMLGLPTRLSEVGVTSDEQVELIAEKTMTDVWGGSGPQLEQHEILKILNTVR